MTANIFRPRRYLSAVALAEMNVETNEAVHNNTRIWPYPPEKRIAVIFQDKEVRQQE